MFATWSEAPLSRIPWLICSNMPLIVVIISAIYTWCLASDWTCSSLCLASDWVTSSLCFVSSSLDWASCSLSSSWLVSNSNTLWWTLLDDRVKTNCDLFVALLPDGVIPKLTPRTHPGRSGWPITWAYTSLLDQRIPLPIPPYSRMPWSFKSAVILSCFPTRTKQHITHHNQYKHKKHIHKINIFKLIWSTFIDYTNQNPLLTMMITITLNKNLKNLTTLKGTN